MSHVFPVLLLALQLVIIPGWLGHRDASIWLLLAYAVALGFWSSWKMSRKGTFATDRNSFMASVALTALACQPAFWLTKLL